MQYNTEDTIVAQATPPGRGGVGIIRIAGPQVPHIAKILLGKIPEPRCATFTAFRDENNSILDQGVALYFAAPNSFTGDDVLELQGHGGPVILDCLLKRILQLGARQAQPGEFSARAFLNDKIDLTQAEAIADLIDASSEQAARAAMRSLQGVFSQRIQQFVEALIQLRIYVEAALDFPEEEIDFLSDGKIAKQLATILNELIQVQTTARQGVLLRDGMTVVIAGKPNAGKSSLLNSLSGQERAIVTDIPGTTRDILREQIQIDGLPLHIIDTAGLRHSDDKVEQEGVRRALAEINKADKILLVVDATHTNCTDHSELLKEFFPAEIKKSITIMRNKIDLLNETSTTQQQQNTTVISISAKTGDGLDLLRQHLKQSVGYTANIEGGFTARRRHLHALETAQQHLLKGQELLTVQRAGELLAEELQLAQRALSEITGEFRSDDLLGRIFSSFCVGK
jgi:tRNA modification GTPase